jgi:hypothetical protein
MSQNRVCLACGAGLAAAAGVPQFEPDPSEAATQELDARADGRHLRGFRTIISGSRHAPGLFRTTINLPPAGRRKAAFPRPRFSTSMPWATRFKDGAAAQVPPTNGG